MASIDNELLDTIYFQMHTYINYVSIPHAALANEFLALICVVLVFGSKCGMLR